MMNQRGYSGNRGPKTLLFVLSLAFLPLANATTVADLQAGWDNANFQLLGKEQQESFEQLIAAADAFTAANPDDADGWVWSGIIKSSFAGIEGGLGALGLAKQAKADFEQSLKLDANAMQGSAYTSLGTLYAGVPGWPLGFGDDKKAEELLLKGLALDPAGIDSNYFYAQFLREEGRSADARKHYEAALQAPARPGRAIADSGRQAEIRAALAELNK
jgi:cytochrome c-type biogenesis protein CcmH/NrfG